MPAALQRCTVLLLPGLHGSGERHWQTLWEQRLPGVTCRRVQQRDWARPDRGEWVAALDAELRAAEPPVLLVAHSLGCALVAHHAAVRAPAAQPAACRLPRRVCAGLTRRSASGRGARRTAASRTRAR
jgi:predicted alpha/beta hydrolase family esterase